jgi:hypothetical protein
MADLQNILAFLAQNGGGLPNLPGGMQPQQQPPSLYSSGDLPSLPAGMGTPQPQIQQPNDVQNIMQYLQQSGGAAPSQVPQSVGMQAAPAQQEASKPRRSLLDTVGRISDVLARVGGAEAMYQPTLDAQQDRTRAIDLENLQKQTMGIQMQGAQGQLAQQQAAMLGQTVKGLRAIGARSGPQGMQRAWPFLAQQMGVPPEKIEEIGMQLQADPEGTLAALEAATLEDKQQGSQTSAVQNFAAYQKILAEQGPEAAEQFLSMAQPASEIQPYQRAQLELQDRRITSAERLAERRIRSAEKIATERTATAAKKATGKGDTSSSQNIVARLGDIRGAVDALDRMSALVKPGETGANIVRRGRSSGIGQLVEGFAGTAAQEQRDLISQTATGIMFNMKQALGLSARDLDTNQDVQRALATINNPNTTKANMMKALDNLETQFKSLLKKAQPQPAGGGNAAAIAEARRRGLIR